MQTIPTPLLSLDRYNQNNTHKNTKNNQNLLVTNKNGQIKRQSRIQFYKSNKRESLNFDDHQYFQEQNKNLMHSKLKECICHHRIIIKPICSHQKQAKYFGKRLNQKTENEDQQNKKEFLTLKKYQSNKIVKEQNIQNEQNSEWIQEKKCISNTLQTKTHKQTYHFNNQHSLINDTIINQNNHNPSSEKKQRKTFSEKIRQIIFINFSSKKKRDKNHEKIQLFTQKSQKTENLSQIFVYPKRENANRKRRLSLGMKGTKESTQQVYKTLKPIQIKSLQLSVREQSIEGSRKIKKGKQLMDYTEDIWNKMKKKKQFLQNQLLKSKERGQKHKGRGIEIRFNLHTSYFNRKNLVHEQKNDLKGWEVQALNSLPQFV